MVSVHNLAINVGGKKIFNDLTLDLATGDNVVIRGRNGSGKTLLLEVLAGLHHGLSGSVQYNFIDERLDWEQRYEMRRRSVLYMQANAFHQFLNSSHDAFYQQRYYSMGSRSVPTVAELIGEDVKKIPSLNFPDEFRIGDLLELEVTRLSNGQSKKMLIIKHLLKHKPKLLLLDYPFEGLDKASRQAFNDFLDHLLRYADMQIVLTDHHHDLPKIINREIVVDNFHIVSSGKLPVRKNFPLVKSFSSTLHAATPVMEMKDVTIQYGQTKIIESFNWKVNKGERWALTGRNGAGKTTLFGMIYADHPMAYSEQVYLFGKRRGTGESIWDIKNRINYLGPEQMHFLNPKAIRVTGREYILSFHNKPENLAQLESFFSAKDLLGKKVLDLSTGELQMILLMIFFMSDKELLLLDEPFQFLDPENKRKVNEYLHDFLHPDSTLILITHYESDIEEWTKLRKHLG